MRCRCSPRLVMMTRTLRHRRYARVVRLHLMYRSCEVQYSVPPGRAHMISPLTPRTFPCEVQFVGRQLSDVPLNGNGKYVHVHQVVG